MISSLVNRNNFYKAIQSPWVISLLILIIFFLTTGYRYGWDDQHLEIPLLKSLIDDSLYQGDYYVESLKKNFTSSLYPILAKVITVDQIPITYFILYVISRYFLFFWIYKIWLHISNNRFKAFYCVLIFILAARVHEFLYRTFSHQEFALAIIFAGIYYFFKERFYLSALLLGIAANFHALYSLFPMLFMCTYLLWQARKHKFSTLIKAGIIFSVTCLPFLIWTIKAKLNLPHIDPPYTEWKRLYQLACPQNFILPQVPLKVLFAHMKEFLDSIMIYLALIALFILNLSFNKPFRENKKAVASCVTAFLLLAVTVVFSYFIPNRFVIDLNLIRNSQFLLFLLAGFTTLMIFDIVEEDNNLYSLWFAVLFTFLKYHEKILMLAVLGMIFTFILRKSVQKKGAIGNILKVASLALLVIISFELAQTFQTVRYRFPTRIALLIISILLTANYFSVYFIKNKRYRALQKYLFLIIPITVFVCQFSFYLYLRSIIYNQNFV